MSEERRIELLQRLTQITREYEDVDSFIFLLTDEGASMSGNGCPACLAGHITGMLLQGRLKYNTSETQPASPLSQKANMN